MQKSYARNFNFKIIRDNNRDQYNNIDFYYF